MVCMKHIQNSELEVKKMEAIKIKETVWNNLEVCHTGARSETELKRSSVN